MIIKVKQWENRYLRDVNQVKEKLITEHELYNALIGLYYTFVSENSIEPFEITYGRDRGFCIIAKSYVGIISNGNISLFIEPNIPNLSLGKILYMSSLTSEDEKSIETNKVLTEQLNDEEEIDAIDYFIISLLYSVADIINNGIVSMLVKEKSIESKIIGNLDLQNQIRKLPSYEKFYVNRPKKINNTLVNQIIKTALVKALNLTKIEWARPQIQEAINNFYDVALIDDVKNITFPKLTDYTSVPRPDYDKALQFSEFILLGFDPLFGFNDSKFPEFLIDMNKVFENYVMISLKNTYKVGFTRKRIMTLGLGPEDVPIEKKFIELDGFYEYGNLKVVFDAKNKYRNIMDFSNEDFFASNQDLYQQFYYAKRMDADYVVLVYPSTKARKKPLSTYTFEFDSDRLVTIILWGLQITSTPKINKQAIVNLAEYISKLD